jgi:hypothetical protein
MEEQAKYGGGAIVRKRPKYLWGLRRRGYNWEVIDDEGHVWRRPSLEEAIEYARDFGADLELEDGCIIQTRDGRVIRLLA